MYVHYKTYTSEKFQRLCYLQCYLQCRLGWEFLRSSPRNNFTSCLDPSNRTIDFPPIVLLFWLSRLFWQAMEQRFSCPYHQQTSFVQCWSTHSNLYRVHTLTSRALLFSCTTSGTTLWPHPCPLPLYGRRNFHSGRCLIACSLLTQYI